MGRISRREQSDSFPRVHLSFKHNMLNLHTSPPQKLWSLHSVRVVMEVGSAFGGGSKICV